MKRWTFKKAYPQSDIIWEDFNKDTIFSNTKTMILWVILLLLSVALVTPVLLTQYWNKLEENMNLEYKFVTQETANEYIQSLSAMLVSLVIIPFFIDIMVVMEDFKTKSMRDVVTINRNFLFMVVNMVFLNLTGLTTIKAFLWDLEK